MTEIRNGNGEKSTKLVIKYGGIVRKNVCLGDKNNGRVKKPGSKFV